MATGSAHPTPAPETGSVLSKATQQLRQLMCGLHGHDSLLHFEDGRISLQCASCGHETPGWDVKATMARRTPAADTTPRVVSMPLVHERRVA